MIADHTPDDRPPLTNDEILDLALAATEAVPGVTCDDVQRTFEAIANAQPSRSQQARNAQRRLMFACRAAAEWPPLMFVTPELTEDEGRALITVARDTAMRELHDVGLGLMAVAICDAYARKTE